MIEIAPFDQEPTRLRQAFGHFPSGVVVAAMDGGAAPANGFDALVAWVEYGKAPDQLTGQKTDGTGNVMLSRPVCKYPTVAVYRGRGDPNDARNFRCANEFSRRYPATRSG